MSHRFFITSLPRSRTAWFSVAMTTPVSICCHEPNYRIKSFQGLVDYWKTDPKIAVGISDSSLCPQLGRILEELRPRTLVVRRDPKAAMQSFADYIRPSGLTPNELENARLVKISIKAMDRYATHELVRTVDYEALDDYSTLLDALQWLLPAWDFPDLPHLKTMNIQLCLNEAIAAASVPHNGWHLKETA